MPPKKAYFPDVLLDEKIKTSDISFSPNVNSQYPAKQDEFLIGIGRRTSLGTCFALSTLNALVAKKGERILDKIVEIGKDKATVHLYWNNEPYDVIVDKTVITEGTDFTRSSLKVNLIMKAFNFSGLNSDNPNLAQRRYEIVDGTDEKEIDYEQVRKKVSSIQKTDTENYFRAQFAEIGQGGDPSAFFQTLAGNSDDKENYGVLKNDFIKHIDKKIERNEKRHEGPIDFDEEVTNYLINRIEEWCDDKDTVLCLSWRGHAVTVERAKSLSSSVRCYNQLTNETYDFPANRIFEVSTMFSVLKLEHGKLKTKSAYNFGPSALNSLKYNWFMKKDDVLKSFKSEFVKYIEKRNVGDRKKLNDFIESQDIEVIGEVNKAFGEIYEQYFKNISKKKYQELCTDDNKKFEDILNETREKLGDVIKNIEDKKRENDEFRKKLDKRKTLSDAQKELEKKVSSLAKKADETMRNMQQRILNKKKCIRKDVTIEQLKDAVTECENLVNEIKDIDEKIKENKEQIVEYNSHTDEFQISTVIDLSKKSGRLMETWTGNISAFKQRMEKMEKERADELKAEEEETFETFKYAKERKLWVKSNNAVTFNELGEAIQKKDRVLIYRYCREYLQAHLEMKDEELIVTGQKTEVGRLRKQAVVKLLDIMEDEKRSDYNDAREQYKQWYVEKYHKPCPRISIDECKDSLKRHSHASSRIKEAYTEIEEAKAKSKSPGKTR